MHLRHLIAGAAVASSSALASPTTQVRDDKPSFGVAFTYANGTFTDVFPIPDSLEVYALGKESPRQELSPPVPSVLSHFAN